MKKYCYLNGKFVCEDKVGVSLRDLGVLRGYAIFEVMRTYNGKPFLLDEHLKRLRNSARELRLVLPECFSCREKLEKIISNLLKRNKYTDANIRIVVTGGVSTDGITLNGNPSVFILNENLHVFPKSIYSKGVRIISHEYKRELPQAKVNSYLTAIRLQKEQRKKKAFEILYVINGMILEATTSNIFMVKNREIITPDTGILLGTTRNLAIRIAKKKAFQVIERPISIEEFLDADEVFLTATNKEIVPVVRVDNKKIGSGKVGEVTKSLLDGYREFARNC